MNTYGDIVWSRRLVKIGVAVGYMVALLLMVTRIVNTDPITWGETMGSLALGAAMAAPATLGLLSLDRRPSLLPAAMVGALVMSVVAFWLLPLWIGIALVWYRAWRGRPVGAALPRKYAILRIGLGFIVAASVLVLFVHVDPVCTQRLSDGTTRSVDAAERGFESGWVLGAGSTYGTSTSSVGDDVASESCTSNTVVIGEAVASLAVTAIVIEAGRRWPQGLRAATRSGTTAAA